MEKWRLTLKLSGLHACPKGGHQRNTHVPPKPVFRGFFPSLLGGGNAYQPGTPPAHKCCPKQLATPLAMPKGTTIANTLAQSKPTCAGAGSSATMGSSNFWEVFIGLISFFLVPSDFDTGENFLHKTLVLKWFLTFGKKFSVSKKRQKTWHRQSCLSVMYIQWFKPTPQCTTPNTKNNYSAVLCHVNKGPLLKECL